MWRIYHLFLAVFVFIATARYTQEALDSGDKLLYVIDFVRHGSRAPKYQGFINSTKVYYNDGLGQITPMGMR